MTETQGVLGDTQEPWKPRHDSLKLPPPFSEHCSKFLAHQKFSANKGLPPPLGRGVCETKSKNGRRRPRNPFISSVSCAQRGFESMVSDHGLGRGQTMG